MAAPDYIKLVRTDTNAVFIGDILTIVAITQQLRGTIQKVIERGFHQIGSGGELTFADFEANHGIPTGKGQAVFDILNGLQLALRGEAQNNRAIELCERVG